MGAERAVSVAERRAAAAASVARKAAPAPAPAAIMRKREDDPATLQRSVAPGPAPVIQPRLAISSPRDPAEQEAERVGAAVARMPATATAPAATPSPSSVQRATDHGHVNADGSPDSGIAGRIQSARSGGAPLPEGVRRFMEPRFGADFGRVRIHTGASAAALAAQLNAHAFTTGRDIFFAQGRFQPDTTEGRELIAHELTHVLQQRGVDYAGSFAAPSATEPGTVHRDKAGGSFLDDLLQKGSELVDFGEEAGWKLVGHYAPDLVPILRGGPGGIGAWVRDKAEGAAQSAFDKIAAPARAVVGAGDQLTARFKPLGDAVRQAAGQIAQNDCTPLRLAAAKIEETATAIVEPIVAFIQPVVAKVKGFLDDVWNLIGAPIWDWIKRVAAVHWAQVQWLWDKVKLVAGWIWEQTATFRAMAGKAWTWLKNKLGIGDGPEGEAGLLQWVQGKLDAAWAVIKARLEPYKQQITTIAAVVGGVLVMVSPAGPIVAIGAAVAGAVEGFRWIKANWGKGKAIVDARAYLQKTLIPSLTSAAGKLMAAVSRAAGALAGALTSVAGGFARAAAAVQNSLLSAAAGIVEWLAGQAQRLADWATGGLAALDAALKSAIQRLQTFLNRMLKFLAKVGEAVVDVWKIGPMIAGDIWNAIPPCIRDPVVDFLGPIILRQIELFRELAKDNEAWQKTKADVMKIIKLVFTDGDLDGALLATFDLILRVFNIPMDLLVQIKAKAIAAWDVISKKPLAFIKNLVRSIGAGFRRLGSNILFHLRYGMEGWLAGDLADRSITLPTDWTSPRQLFDFALDVMGISVNHMFELLAKRFDPDKVKKLQLWYGRIGAAVDFVNKSIDVNKSPQENAKGLIDRAKDFAGTIFTGLAEWVAAQVAKELAAMAVAAAASAGLSEVLDIARRIYKAMVAAVKYARRLLDMVNQALDNVLGIAAGAVEAVGVTVEAILHKGMPVVIGFLANQVGLGGAGEEIKSIIDKLREKVDEGILWLIDKIKGALEAVINTVKAGAAALLEWWRKTVPIGEGKEKHTLQFDGREEDSVLRVHSQPEDVSVFVKRFETADGATAKAMTLNDSIREKQKRFREAKKAGKDADATRIGGELVDKMEKLGEILTKLISGSADGSEKQPLAIVYPKREAFKYPDIYTGPLTDDFVDQDVLKIAYKAKKADAVKLLADKGVKATKAWDGKVRRFSAVNKDNLDNGSEVGLSPDFAAIGPGRILIYDEKAGTGGGGKINDRFAPFGFRAKLQGLDGDHVLERQLGGPDNYNNLWPLPFRENRSSGSRVKSLKVKYRNKEMTVHEARDDRGKALHLLIKSVAPAED